jgi:hypothetical protein
MQTLENNLRQTKNEDQMDRAEELKGEKMTEKQKGYRRRRG